MQVDFFEYLQVVHDAFETDGPECNIEWKKAITEVESVIDGPPHDWKKLSGKVVDVKLIIYISKQSKHKLVPENYRILSCMQTCFRFI